jgi:hypothetical protein
MEVGMKTPYTFSVLRYVHDPVSTGFVEEDETDDFADASRNEIKEHGE